MSDETEKAIDAMRDFGVAVLAKRYGHLEPIPGGRGVPRGTRLSFVENGKTLTCAIRASAGEHGRIHFAYNDEEKDWGILSRVDRVLYIRRSPERPGEFEAQMHEQKTLLDAFNKNRRAAEAKNFLNLPPWLSADLETSERLIGSGFGKFALWKEFSGAAKEEKSNGAIRSEVRPLNIVEAKRALAAFYGVGLDAIEITIRG